MEQKIAEHAQAERVLKRLEGMPTADAEFPELTADLVAKTRHHAQVEETNLFPRLRQACPPEQLRRLAGMAEMAMRTAATRPHPTAPDRPPWTRCSPQAPAGRGRRNGRRRLLVFA